MIRASLLALTMLWSLAAFADVTIRNFDGGGIARINQIAKVDVNGDRIRSDNEGPIVQWPGDPLFYLYGVDNSRPDLAFTTANFGGFTVYTSPDLVQWTPAGGVDGLHMVDPNITAWHNTCGSGPYQTPTVCWLPRPIFSAGLGKYVLWFNNVNQNFSVICDTKVGGCAIPGAASACETAGIKSQNANPFIDTDTGIGYLVYSVDDHAGPAFSTYIRQLNANYTDCTGAATLVVAGAGEVPSMFKRGSTFYIVQSNPLCAFCSGVQSYYYTATNPLGTWSAATRFDTSNACGTQHNITSKLVIGGNDVYLYTAFFWDLGAGTMPSGFGEDSQTLSNQFWMPLTFAGTAINTFTCPATFTLTGLNPAPPPAMMNVDQTDENAPANSLCDINSAMQRAQTFTPSRSANLNEIWVRTGSGNATCYFTACPSPVGANADLIVTLKATSGGLPTGAALATMTLPATGRLWGVFRQKLPVPGNVSVVAGTQYAIILSSTATIGCWTFMYSNTNPYAGGNSLYSTNGGSTWTAQSGGDLMFSTVLDTGAPGGKGWFR